MQLLLLLCLATQAQNAEAKKLLDALAPPLKDPSYSQIEFERGPVKVIGTFSRQRAWKLDSTSGDGGLLLLYDGKAFLQYSKKRNDYFRKDAEFPDILILMGGPLAEIHYSGNADRLLKDAKQVTVKKERLNDLDCTHVVIAKKDAVDTEHHLWIDAAQNCVRAQRKGKSNGKPFETTFTYRVVDASGVSDEAFNFQPPADAKDKGR
jgi:hypothetical protein